MTFQAILSQFKSLSSGTEAFKQLKKDCEALILSGAATEESTALFLIYGFARSYVLLYEDDPVTSEFSQAAKQQLIVYMEQMNQAFQANDPAKILQAYNDVVQDYMKGQRVF